MGFCTVAADFDTLFTTVLRSYIQYSTTNCMGELANYCSGEPEQQLELSEVWVLAGSYSTFLSTPSIQCHLFHCGPPIYSQTSLRTIMTTPVSNQYKVITIG